MLGELTIEGIVKAPEGYRFSSVFWPSMALHINHNMQLSPIGKVRSLIFKPDGSAHITADISWSWRALTILSVAPGLSIAGAHNKAQGSMTLEILNFSIVQYSANTCSEEKEIWRVTSGRLPRVIYDWRGYVKSWPGAEVVEQFEVGWSAHGDLAEVEPRFAIHDNRALMELMK